MHDPAERLAALVAQDPADFLNASVSKVLVVNLLGFALVSVRDALSNVRDLSCGGQESR
jgi:hypothetical protein